jgi:hypothetical protein
VKTGLGSPCAANKFMVAVMAMFIALHSIISVGCGKTSNTLQSVLNEAPVVISIVNTGIDLYNVVDPEGADAQLKNTVDAFIAEGTRDVSTLVTLIRAYQANFAEAPTGTLQQADALVAAIQAQEAALVAAFHLKSPRAQSEAAAIVDGIQSFLAQLALFLPSSAEQQAPAAAAVVRQQSAQVGVVKVISAQQLAQRFNEASGKNYPEISVVAR